MHYYQFNIGDYHCHTAHLDPLEDIAYRRMMDWCYLHESPLPDDIDEIAKKIRMRTHCECIANVLREFFFLTDEGWSNARILKEVNAFKAKSDKAKASARARWDKKPSKINKKDSDANALRTECEGNAKHKTRTTKQELLTNKVIKESTKEKKPRKMKPEKFKQFFDIYPAHRKGGTSASAWKAWQSEGLGEESAALALLWLQNAAMNDQGWGVDGGGQFVLGITKFIRDQQWLTPIPSKPNEKPNEFNFTEANKKTDWMDKLAEKMKNQTTGYP